MKLPSYLDAILRDPSDFARIRSLLFDGVTGLPTLPLIIESMKDTAAEQQRLGIIFIDISRLEALERDHGWEMVDDLLRHVRVFFDSISARFTPLKVFPLHRIAGDNFLMIVSSSEPGKPVSAVQVAHVCNELEERVNEYLAYRLPSELVPFGRVFAGCSVLDYNANVRFERALSRTINQAFHAALNQQEKLRELQIQQLQDIVNANQIRVLFQPIFRLQDQNEVLGYEALSRGPEGTLFEAAEFMFTLAGSCGLLDRLENLCQVRLISTLQKQLSSKLFFVNLEPSFLEKEHYQTLALFNNPAVNPENVVLEITERIAINDYSVVMKSLESIRKLGFRIAVDDVGSGYASLQSIAYLKPDFIKVNEKMVQGISRDFIKQEIVKTLRDLGSKFSASVIAEGIEEQKDLDTLLHLNVPFGQGYLLQRPASSLEL